MTLRAQQLAAGIDLRRSTNSLLSQAYVCCGDDYARCVDLRVSWDHARATPPLVGETVADWLSRLGIYLSGDERLTWLFGELYTRLCKGRRTEDSGALHGLLVRKAARWLVRSRRCTFVMLEPWHVHSEQPDVIGWGMNGWSVLVECKASRGDFLRDKHKWFRRESARDWSQGLGQERWYAAAQGAIKDPSELPDRWGWVELCGTRFCVRRPANPSGICKCDTSILQREFSIMLSSLRKAHKGYTDSGSMPFAEGK